MYQSGVIFKIHYMVMLVACGLAAFSVFSAEDDISPVPDSVIDALLPPRSLSVESFTPAGQSEPLWGLDEPARVVKRPHPKTSRKKQLVPVTGEGSAVHQADTLLSRQDSLQKPDFLVQKEVSVLTLPESVEVLLSSSEPGVDTEPVFHLNGDVALPDGPGISPDGWIKLIAAMLIGALVAGAILVVVIVLSRQKKDQRRFMTTNRLSIMDKEVQRACLYIEEWYADPELTVDRVCIALVTGKAFLDALFERDLGLKLEQYIDQARVHRAKLKMALDASLTGETIASVTGFIDRSSFLATFKKVTGVTFEEYRLARRS